MQEKRSLLHTMFPANLENTLSMLELQARLIDLSHDAIIVCDPARRIYTWNRGAEQLYGWTEEEARGQITHNLLLAELPVPLSQIEQQLESEGQWEGELIHTCRDGQRIIVESRWVLERDAQGKPLAIMEVNRDVTARKQMEIEQEERVRLAMNAAQAGMWEWNTITNRMEWTEQCKALFGLPVETVMSYDLFLSKVHPDDRERVSQEVQRSLKDHYLYESEYRVIWPDGSIHWLTSRGRASYDEQGDALGMLGIVHDITERKRLERILSQSEIEIQSLRNSSIIGIVSADKDYVLEANDAFLAMVGYTREDMQQKRINWSQMTPPEYLSLDQHGLQELLEYGVCTPFEKAYYRKDGSIVPILIGATLLQREPLQWVCFILDITERKRVEEALIRSEQHFKTLAEHIPDVVARFDNNLRYLYVNPAIAEFAGRPPEIFIGKTNEEVGMPTYILGTWNAAVRQVFTTQQPTTFEITFPTSIGMRSMQASLTPELDEQGNVLSVLAVSREVTELRDKQERLQHALDALLTVAEVLVSDLADTPLDEPKTMRREVAKSILAPVCEVLTCAGGVMNIFTAESEIFEEVITVGFNPEIERIIQKRVGGLPLAARMPESMIQQLRAGESIEMDLRLPPYQERQPLPHLEYALVVPMRYKARLFGLITLYPVNSAQRYSKNEIALAAAIGKLAALLIERENILYEREEAKSNALAALEANRRMDEFLGIVSHELRTPLTSIRGNIQLAARRVMMLLQPEGGRDEPRSETVLVVEKLLQRADRQVGVQNRLVNDLLDVSRIHADRLELHPELCDIWQIVREVVEDQRQVMTARTIRLEGQPWEALVFADADRVAQVISNYLSNALKYSETTQPVEVRVERLTSSVRISVQDWGPGLSAEMQERVWERFYRVPGIMVKSGSGVGLGLGLHICKTIIERHGGSVGVMSRPGQGSTFWFTLPLAEHEAV